MMHYSAQTAYKYIGMYCRHTQRGKGLLENVGKLQMPSRGTILHKIDAIVDAFLYKSQMDVEFEQNSLMTEYIGN